MTDFALDFDDAEYPFLDDDFVLMESVVKIETSVMLDMVIDRFVGLLLFGFNVRRNHDIDPFVLDVVISGRGTLFLFCCERIGCSSGGAL